MQDCNVGVIGCATLRSVWDCFYGCLALDLCKTKQQSRQVLTTMILGVQHVHGALAMKAETQYSHTCAMVFGEAGPGGGASKLVARAGSMSLESSRPAISSRQTFCICL